MTAHELRVEIEALNDLIDDYICNAQEAGDEVEYWQMIDYIDDLREERRVLVNRLMCEE